MGSERREKLKQIASEFPEQPGIYMFRDSSGTVLYVGKAVSLVNRVRSYFHSSTALNTRTMKMLEAAHDIEYIVTDNEIEALILESNLIKRHRPKYNIRLRDDKHYPYVEVTTGEEFPRVRIVRRTENPDHRYFGPYTESGALRKTLDLLRKVFPFRTCSNWRLERSSRPCLHFQTERCLAPCTQQVTSEEYDEMIEGLNRFFSGRSDDIIEKLQREMEAAADELNFERAGQLRDQIEALSKVSERQKVLSASSAEDEDIIGIARDEDRVCVAVMFLREGKLVGQEHFFPTNTEGAGDDEVLEAFLRDYYAEDPLIPGRIEIPVEMENSDPLQRWLREKRQGRVRIHRPQRGRRRRLMDMACRNAQLLLQQEGDKSRGLKPEAAERLGEILNLPDVPKRIEGYDISVLSGTAAVGSMVVFENASAARYAYRRFRIKEAPSDDDTAMLREVLSRRFARLDKVRRDDRAAESPESSMDSFSKRPDLVLVDGGKGQLSAAELVLDEYDFEISVCGLAKKEELIHVPHEDEPLRLPRSSMALQLLQQVRDEAHRFAQDYHHRLRRQRSLRSILDDIKGIGPKRRGVLLRHFDSLQEIAKASIEQLAALDGMTRRAARSVHEFLSDYRDQ